MLREFQHQLEEVATERQEGLEEGDTGGMPSRQLQFHDGLDQVLVDGHEIRMILFIDHHIGEADKEALLFVNRIGHTITHRGNEEVADIGAAYSSDADANFLAFGH
jgi:hypothetical protein